MPVGHYGLTLTGRGVQFSPVSTNPAGPPKWDPAFVHVAHRSDDGGDTVTKDIDVERGLTISLDGHTVGRLESLGRENGPTPLDFAGTLLEEGLRMAAHPGIVFRPGSEVTAG